MPRGVAVVAVVLLTVTAALGADTAPGLRVACHAGRLEVTATDRPLPELLAAIGRACGVAVRGLERLPDEKVSFRAAEAADDALRRLMRQARVANVAMVYADEVLRQVIILPVGRTKGRRPAPPSPPQFAASTDAVEVSRVIPGSQAADKGLRPGDLVVAYDGQRIRSPRDLIRLSQATPPGQRVVMTLLRNGDGVEVAVAGGFIGVRIRPVKIFASELTEFGFD